MPVAISEKLSRNSSPSVGPTTSCSLPSKIPDERSFYEIEATKKAGLLPELKRQIASCLYERLALSRDKEGIQQPCGGRPDHHPAGGLLKEPLRPRIPRPRGEGRLLRDRHRNGHHQPLERFLLELGKGFLFEARQKRFTFDEDHYFLDLVFYNRLLRCYVLIDLKLDKLTHQDRAQIRFWKVFFLESQRDSATKPRVARNELPWGNGSEEQNPNGVSASVNVRRVSQPRWGCCFARFLPRVARASQPWALGRNPFGIGRLPKSDLRPQDLGQMQMYVNHYHRHVKLAEENSTVGLLLCKEKKDAVVKLTLPKDANIHAKEYNLYLPSKELLKAKLLEWTQQESMKVEG